MKPMNVMQHRADFPRYGRQLVYTRYPDPILDLWTVRSIALEQKANPAAQQRYGELLQRVVSPLDRSLP